MNSSAEYVPDSSAIHTENRLKRVDIECSRKIAAAYPLQDQINILFSLMADKIGVNLSGDFARDRDRAMDYLKFSLEHRLAAESLKRFISKNPDQAAAIDVSNVHYWPKSERSKA